MTVAATPGTGNVPAAVQVPAAKGGHAFPWKALLPIAVTVVLAIIPPPKASRSMRGTSSPSSPASSSA